MKNRGVGVLNIIILLIIAGILLTSKNIFAWWSAKTVGDSTHYRLSDGAIKNIPADQYPDITLKFGSNITAWTSGIEDDERAHGNDGTSISSLLNL